LLLGAGLATVGGSLARLWWGLELMCHFRVQYMAALAVAAALLALASARRHAGAAALLATWNGVLIAPLYFPPDVPPGLSGGVPWRLAVANVFSGNPTPDRVLEFLRAEQPDVAVIPELTPAWERRLEGIEDLFPYLRVESREGNFGIGLYSRVPIESAEIVSVAGGNIAVVARLRKEGQPLTVIGAHTYPPGGSRTETRDRQLRQLAERAADVEGPCVIIGDLNTTSWSPGFQECLRISSLRDSRRGFGVQPTWPAGRGVLRIPIDHCLVSEGIVVKDWRVGPDVGSDHLPVVVECRLQVAQ
jgi:endonuclease/exonuclease/phosphatase (EEP) superfamily protein YafD